MGHSKNKKNKMMKIKNKITIVKPKLKFFEMKYKNYDDPLLNL